MSETAELYEILFENKSAEETGKRLENAVRTLLDSRGVLDSGKGGGTEAYDVATTADVKINRIVIPAGIHEVKMLTGSILARLGAEKIRNLVRDPYITSLMRLGQALNSMSETFQGDESSLAQSVYTKFFVPEGESSIDLASALMSLEISSTRLRIVTNKETFEKQYLTPLLTLVRKKQNIKDEVKTVDITVSAAGIGTNPGEQIANFQNVDKGTFEDRIAPAIGKAVRNKGDKSTLDELTPLILDVMENIPNDQDGWLRELAVKSSGKIKGFFGVTDNLDIFYFLNEKGSVKANNITQGGRLVIEVEPTPLYDITQYGVNAEFEDQASKTKIRKMSDVLQLTLYQAFEAVSNSDSQLQDDLVRYISRILKDKGVVIPVMGKSRKVTKDASVSINTKAKFPKAWDALQRLKDVPDDALVPNSAYNAKDIKQKTIGQLVYGDLSESARDRKRSKRNEVSMGGVVGVTTPLGTDASGGKGGPGVRKGKGKSILDRNAKSQGKFFGRAKRVNESSTFSSLGRYLYTDVEFGDYDLDNDGEGDLDSKSVFRGGGGNLKKNAATTGKSFAGAKPVNESIELLEELLEELLDND